MTRSHGAVRDLAQALNIEDLRRIARRKLPGFAFEYLEGGAEDEWSLSNNREAFKRVALLPRQLVDVSSVDTGASFLGRTASAPIVIAPTGYNGMLSREGDLALARAAKRRGIAFIQSTMSTSSIEQVSAAVEGGRHWFQLYILKDESVTSRLIVRARDAGCEALVVTTDAVALGNREWDRRNYARPQVLTWRAKLDTAFHPRWVLDVLIPHGVPKFGNLTEFLPKDKQSARGGAHFIANQMDATISWKTIELVRSIWPRKLVVKGILRSDDAERAAEVGADAIVISNHGGRQLEGAPSPVDVVAEIADKLRGRCEILVDSGFRRGTDVFKALALGAGAVVCGRAALYGLAAAGDRGVERALEILTTEFERTMKLMGCRKVGDIDSSAIRIVGDLRSLR
jgi:(S)-mandelate dehydrogenase